MTRTPFFAALVALIGAPAFAVEYLPPVEWQAPPIVTPGETNDAPPSDAIVLFDGTDLSAWENGQNWKVADGVATVGKGAIRTKQHFGDCQLHIEWTAPVPAKGKGQGRGNSGVFFMGTYEVQVLDCFENTTYPEGQATAIYKQMPPMVNAMRPPGEWNVYDLFWTCPRWEGDEVVKPASVTVVHNGVLVINHYELTGATPYNEPPSYTNRAEKGPIMLQDHRNPVRFRNIWIRELTPPVGKPRPAMYRQGGKKWPVELGPDEPKAEEE